MDALKHRIILLFINIFLGGYSGKREIRFNSYQDSVYIFKSAPVSGMYFWFDKILLNKKLFEDGFENAKDYVYMHEVGHRKDSTPLEWIGGILQHSLHPVFLTVELTLILTAITSYFSIIQISPNVAEFVLVAAIASLILFPAAIISSWIVELKAEFFAIDHIGKDSYQKAVDELSKIASSSSAVGRLFIKISHPPPSFVTKTYEKFREN